MRKIIFCIVCCVVLAACGRPLNLKYPWELKIYEMFPDNPQAQKLAMAAQHGDIKRIEELVAEGADVNAIGFEGMTILGWLVYHPSQGEDFTSNMLGFKRLLELGANPNLIWKRTTSGGRNDDSSVLHDLAMGESYPAPEFLKLAFDFGNGNPNLSVDNWRGRLLDLADGLGGTKVFTVIYNAGAEVNYIDRNMSSPFVMNLSYERNFEALYFLLLDGIDFTQKNNGMDFITKQRFRFGVDASMSSHLKDNRDWAIDPKDSQFTWFWLCIEFLEKRGVVIEIPPHIKRPENLVRPKSYIFDNARRRNLHN